MKKRMASLISLFCKAFFIFFLAGCSNVVLVEKRSESKNSAQNVQYGILNINKAEESARAIKIDALRFANVEVIGSGIETPITGEAAIQNGAGSFYNIKVPVGKNRIVTVVAQDSSKEKISGVIIRAVTDIVSGENNVTVNWNTTALANVFYELQTTGFDVSTIADEDKTKIQNAIDTTKHASLINTSAIASDYKSGVSSLKDKSNYVLNPLNLNVTYSGNDKYKVQVGDPISEILECTTATSTVNNIAPGAWEVYILDVVTSQVITHKTVSILAENTEVSFDESSASQIKDKIILHVYGYTHIWAWNKNGVSGNLFAGWPGQEMTDEGNGWKGWVFEDTTSLSLIFSNNGGADKTGDLTQNAGEWWYKGGEWTDYNPLDTTAPVLNSFTINKSGEVTGEVTFTITASDNLGLSYAFIKEGEKLLSKVSLSGAESTATWTWDTAEAKNGSHTITCTVYDASNLASNSKDVTFTTNNENTPPVAVISGASQVGMGSNKTYSALSSYDKNGTVVSYSWSITGDGTFENNAITSTESNVVVNFSDKENGSATISLTVTDDEGATSVQVSKIVNIVAQNGDFREESIYFLMTTRFYDGDESNNEYCWDEGGEYLKMTEGDCSWRGDFKGLAQKLDYIKALGFSAIWITPVVENASGIDYHGYHAYDFSKVDPRYESTDFTYQDLIDACHAKGIKVIQDIVLNHTGNFGERNLFHMFDKDTEPYINKDVPLANGKRSPFMKVATSGNAYEKLMAGLSMAGGTDYDTAIGGIQYGARINAMKEDKIDTDFIYHHTKMIDWNSENCQLGQMAGDCVDLNTENPVVAKYLRDCYVNYINMGIDGFRIDTVKHISRLTFNKEFIPAFMEAGGDDFYIFGETCARYRGRWNEGVPALSPSFYSWKETESFPWSSTDHTVNSASATAHFGTYNSNFTAPRAAGVTPNHNLKGNEYHTPDYSLRSYLDQIDFPMHWAFNSAYDAFNVAKDFDSDYNDASWNVTYVDSHDYAPDNAPESQRFNGTWPDKLNLMFTFRGIPCIYYGSEIEFKKGMPIDPANIRTSLEGSGRAYLGTHLEGTVTATDYGTYTASGAVAETLNHELAQHIIRLNQIRRAIPALQKGQYSTEGCNGGISFKRRYTDTKTGVDSFALVTINGQATFSGVPSGEYIEVVTGKTVNCNGTLTSDAIGQNNMRVYVLKTNSCDITGKIGKDGTYLK